MKDKPFF